MFGWSSCFKTSTSARKLSVELLTRLFGTFLMARAPSLPLRRRAGVPLLLSRTRGKASQVDPAAPSPNRSPKSYRS
eukprot:Skav214089  [mRNA]  locus=scaffold5449:22024:23711:- [translate_table: standard]